MQTREARLLFNAGAITTAVIRQTAGGWRVELTGKHRLDPMLELSRGGPRVFKTLEAAVEATFALGFTHLQVEKTP